MTNIDGARPKDHGLPILVLCISGKSRASLLGLVNVLVGRENQIERLLVVLGCLNFELMCDGCGL